MSQEKQPEKSAPAVQADWRQRLKKIGKAEFIREEMERLGFWPPEEGVEANMREAEAQLAPLYPELRALRQELAWEGARLNMGLDMGLDTCLNASGKRRVTSIFFGGGTPSLMAPETVAALIEDAATHFDLAPDAEITLEANPTSV